jgi:hypothetical protein
MKLFELQGSNSTIQKLERIFKSKLGKLLVSFHQHLVILVIYISMIMVPFKLTFQSLKGV